MTGGGRDGGAGGGDGEPQMPLTSGAARLQVLVWIALATRAANRLARAWRRPLGARVRRLDVHRVDVLLGVAVVVRDVERAVRVLSRHGARRREQHLSRWMSWSSVRARGTPAPPPSR